MSINLNVTIKKDGPDEGYLDVDQSGNANHVPKNASQQTITWKLIGNANGGTFNALNAPNPGFSWKGTEPPLGIFGAAVPDAHGNMTMTDNNTPASPSGTWVYQLWATINGQQYTTLATLGIKQVTRDPTIVNN
jgi:hypothetical protein